MSELPHGYDEGHRDGYGKGYADGVAAGRRAGRPVEPDAAILCLSPDRDGYRCAYLARHEGEHSHETAARIVRDAAVDPLARGHRFKPGRFGGGCQVMLARYPCPVPEERHSLDGGAA